MTPAIRQQCGRGLDARAYGLAALHGIVQLQLWVPKTCVTWLNAPLTAGRWPLGPAPAGAWDDLRLVGVKLIFLIVTRAVSLLGLSRREWWQKDAEILMLRHQLAVAERERPRAHSRLTWPDRAWLALLAGTVPAERLAVMRLIVTPGTILRWHRDLVRRRWGRLSRRGRAGRPATPRKVRSVVLRLARENESSGTGGSTASLRGSASCWRRPRSGGSSRAPGLTGLRAGMARAGRSSSGPRRRGSWRWTSSPPTCSTARRSTSLPSSSTAPAASGSSGPPSIRSSRG